MLLLLRLKIVAVTLFGNRIGPLKAAYPDR